MVFCESCQIHKQKCKDCLIQTLSCPVCYNRKEEDSSFCSDFCCELYQKTVRKTKDYFILLDLVDALELPFEAYGKYLHDKFKIAKYWNFNIYRPKLRIIDAF